MPTQDLVADPKALHQLMSVHSLRPSSETCNSYPSIPIADVQSSRRHSLYGIEDRIVIESAIEQTSKAKLTTSPGSRVWKVGFSGEPNPRAVFWAEPAISTQKFSSVKASGPCGQLFDLDLDDLGVIDRKEANRLIGVRITRNLRSVFSQYVTIRHGPISGGTDYQTSAHRLEIPKGHRPREHVPPHSGQRAYCRSAI